LDTVAEKINRASYGYSGFFDAVKVEEPELDDMLAYDTQLMDLARKINDVTAAFKTDLTQGKLENARTTQQSLGMEIDTLDSAFDQRKAVIEGVKV